MKRVRSVLPALISALALLALALPASANTGPSGDILIHVRPYDGQPPQLDDCSQIVQHTEATGWIEFDLYLHTPGYAIHPRSVVVELDWSATWNYLGHEVASGGEGEFNPYVNPVLCTLSWPDCPPATSDLQLLLRLWLWVPGPGEMWSPSGYPEVFLCPPWDYELWGVEVAAAAAGVVCGYPQDPCNGGIHCWPQADFPLIELAAIPGDIAQATLHFTFRSHWWSGCSTTCQGTADWMHVSGQMVFEFQRYTVFLQVNTAGLAPGDYSGWVQVDSGGGRGCTEVLLHVLTPTGVSPVDDAVSWSLIKSLY